MQDRVLTSVVTHEYFNQARVMIKSFLRYNEGYDVVLFADDDIGLEGVETVSINEPKFERKDVVKFSRIEMIRAQCHLELLERGYKSVLYCDSDIYFTRTFPLYAKSVFTPHHIDSVGKCNPRWIMDDGFFNIGIYWLVNDEATITFLKILDMMSQKLEKGYNTKPSGDAYWQQCLYNYLPLFHRDYIMCNDVGINVAYWNLKERGILTYNDGQYYIGGDIPLICYHFSHWSRKEVMSKYDRSSVKGLGACARLYNEYSTMLEKEKKIQSEYK